MYQICCLVIIIKTEIDCVVQDFLQVKLAHL